MLRKTWILVSGGAVAGAVVMWLALSLTQATTVMTKPTLHPTQTQASDPAVVVGAKVYDSSKSPADALPDDYMPADNASLPAGSLDAVADAKFPAAKTALELTLFKASAVSCAKLKDTGVKLYSADGSYELISVNKAGEYQGNSFDNKGVFQRALIYSDAAPLLCDPDELNQQVIRGNTNLAVNFLVESTDAIEFIWHSHHGGSDLSTTSFVIQSGLITQIFDSGSVSYVRYGLSAKERASALQNY